MNYSQKTHQRPSTPHTLNDGKYDLTTKARRNNEGAGRQSLQCRDLLNCVALVAFRKYGTWVQIWTGIFGVHLHKSAIIHLA